MDVSDGSATAESANVLSAVLYAQIPDNTVATPLETADGTANGFDIAQLNATEGTVWFFDGTVVAQRAGVANLWSVVRITDGVVTRNAAGTVAITVAPTITELVDAGNITVTVDASGTLLRVLVATGDSAGNEAVEAVAYLRLQGLKLAP